METDMIIDSIREGCKVYDLLYVVTYVEYLKKSGCRVDDRLRKLRNVLAHWADYKSSDFMSYEDFMEIDIVSLRAIKRKVKV